MADEENKNVDQNQEETKNQHAEESEGTPEGGVEEESSGGFKPSKGMIIGGLILFVVVLFFAQQYIHFGDSDHKDKAKSKNAHHENVNPPKTAPRLPKPSSSPKSSSMKEGESLVPQSSAIESVPSAPVAPAKPDKKQIEAIIGKYIEDNPEVVAKALQNLNAKMDNQRKLASKNYLKDNMQKILSNKLYLGNPNGSDVIVEFFDYKCSYCRRSHLVMERVLKDYPSVKLVLLPVPMLGQNSAEAVRSAMAVWKLSPSHFSKFHEELINSQSIDDNTINSIVAKLGISSESLAKEMKSPEVQKMIDENLEIAQNVGIRGVPTFIVRGELVPGSLSYEGFKEMLDKYKSK